MTGGVGFDHDDEDLPRPADLVDRDTGQGIGVLPFVLILAALVLLVVLL